MSVNALRIRHVEDEDKGRPNEKKRRERRFVTSSGTHGSKVSTELPLESIFYFLKIGPK